MDCPTGTHALRPIVIPVGSIRPNDESLVYEIYIDGEWRPVDPNAELTYNDLMLTLETNHDSNS